MKVGDTTKETQGFEKGTLISTGLALLPFCSLLVASKYPRSNPLTHRFASSLARLAGDRVAFAFASLPVLTSGLGFGWLHVCQKAGNIVRSWEVGDK